MTRKSIITLFILFFAACNGCVSSGAKVVVHTKTDLELELIGYNGLDESSIFKGNFIAGRKQEINTPYRGLALLSFAGGQSYPVILGNEPFTLNITDPGQIPTFTGSTESDHLYKSLSGNAPVPEQYAFAHLMIKAKELLESTHSIKTLDELSAKKQEYHQFVIKHYNSLKHSDMVKRLIGQYFMMHEYINYHVEGAPPTDIKRKYQNEVVSGVGNWLEILKPHIPEQEVLNYCVSLYYNRSMVTLASLIIDNFEDAAYCPGDEKETFSFPEAMTITDGNTDKKLGDIKGNKLIAFVSDDCPVSMVKTVSKARHLARQKTGVPLIVAPLQTLSSMHLVMSRMISGGNLFYLNDEEWRKNNLIKKIRLPLLVKIGADNISSKP